MICRLCFLSQETEDSIDIFTTNGKEIENNSDMVIIINKYLHIELQPSDPVSTSICQDCYTKLWDFHQFCLIIVDKQQELLFKAKEPEWIEAFSVPQNQDPIAPDQESSILDCETMVDIKDFTLCKQAIDENTNQQNEQQLENYDCFHTTEDPVHDDCSDVANTLDILADIPLKKKTKSKITKAMKSSKQQPTAKKRQMVKKAKVAESSLLSIGEKRSLRIRLRAFDANCLNALETIKQNTTKKTITKIKKDEQPPKATPRQQMKAKDDFAKRMLKSSELDSYINENVKLECAICSIPMSDFGMLKRHFRLEHKCIGYVVCCNNQFKKRSIFVDHLIVHKDPDYFNCKACNKKFVSRNCLRSHDLRYHSEEKTHQCKLCAKSYAKPFLLTQHMRVHQANRERTEQCEHCVKSFRMPYELKAHIRRMHDASIAPIICDICGSNFRTKQNFILHRSTVHQEGPQQPEVQCPVCNRWLRNKNSLRKHMYFHREPEQPDAFKCNECGALKSSRHKLLFHKRYHHSKRHKCKLCDKEFKQTVTLTEHMATHTGIDLYSCEFCTRTFKSHANMHNHKKKMHPDQWVRKYTKPTVSQQQQQQESNSIDNHKEEEVEFISDLNSVT